MEHTRIEDTGGDHGLSRLAAARHHPRPTNHCKVLLAGDGREHRAGLARVLRGQGFEVVEYEEWLHLVQSIRRAPLFEISGDPADVIVIDIRASGATALDQVSAVARPDAPMIVITSASGAQLDGEGHDNRVVLEEPLDIELLRKAVLAVSQFRV